MYFSQHRHGITLHISTGLYRICMIKWKQFILLRKADYKINLMIVVALK